jgi:hypothetical protein
MGKRKARRLKSCTDASIGIREDMPTSIAQAGDLLSPTLDRSQRLLLGAERGR